MQLAIQHSHSATQTITDTLQDARAPFTRPDGRITLPAWGRVVLAQAKTPACWQNVASALSRERRS